jgi:hypothetical protein
MAAGPHVPNRWILVSASSFAVAKTKSDPINICRTPPGTRDEIDNY